MTRIARPIGKADMEFYEGAIVMRLAHSLSGKTGDAWDSLSHRSKTHWLNKATATACDLLGDVAVVQRLPALSKNLTSRL